jgi:hypothetical protein
VGAKRRIDVMLSSTFLDLRRHREAVIAAMNGLQFTPLAQEFDAALSDSDLIKASLDKVDKADAYVGLIGSRYGQRPVCPIRNPERLSLTELEFRRAVERGLPRCTFIMGADHTLTRADLDRSIAEGMESHNKRRDFIEFVNKERITAEFTSPDDLKAKATTSFVALRELLDRADAVSPASDTAALPPSPDDFLPTAPPAFHHVRKPYVEKQGFAGRAEELTLIDQWATGPFAMLLFQAIGGMGKSMLTWHWLRTRATAVRSDWAGRLWYSFYEQGADLNDFCVHALAYIRHMPPKTFRGRRTLDLGDELRRELDSRPWLLILDGLERVLVAYNRAGKAHMTDDEAAVTRDDMGLDREPRDCFRPEEDDVLAMLAQAGQGKLLASSRLTPTPLMNTSRQPIPGVMRLALEGLGPEDAEQLLRNVGVHGDSWRMRRFLADNFAGHPLSIGVVTGQIMSFLEARGDFDRWVEHARGGADPALITKDLRGRQNHILSRAFDDLGDEEKALLGSIAMTNLHLTPELLRILNPKRPLEPKKVAPPKKWAEEELYLLTHDADINKAYRTWTNSKSSNERAEAQHRLDELRDRNLAERKRLYETYVANLATWEQSTRLADAWLERTLPTLEARGLLQYDADTSSLDMHPAIRHTVLIGLSPEARSRTCSHLSDAMSSRPVKPFEEARTRDDLAVAITRVEAINTAGKLAEGWDLLLGDLEDTLSRLEYSYETLELMHPYFPQGWVRGPLLLPLDQHASAFHTAAVALRRTGQFELASELYIKCINLRLGEESNAGNVGGAIGDLTVALEWRGLNADSTRLRSLAVRLAEANGNRGPLALQRVNQVERHVRGARLEQAQALLKLLWDQVANQEISPFYECTIIYSDLLTAFRTGRLTEEIAEQRLQRIRSLGQHGFVERECLAIIAEWQQHNDNHYDALDTYSYLVARANETGTLELPAYEARRAISLAALGRREDAHRVAAKVDRGTKLPHVPLALLYLELGDQIKARAHALAGHKVAWGEGPPHHDHWNLDDCRKVFAAVGEPEPSLSPFDPSTIKPFAFESDVERLIGKSLTKKAKEAEERLKADGTRQAKATQRNGSSLS